MFVCYHQRSFVGSSVVIGSFFVRKRGVAYSTGNGHTHWEAIEMIPLFLFDDVSRTCLLVFSFLRPYLSS